MKVVAAEVVDWSGVGGELEVLEVAARLSAGSRLSE